MRTTLWARLGLLAIAGLTGSVAWGQETPDLEQITMAVDVDSALVVNTSDKRALIYSTTIKMTDAGWIRLRFDHATRLGRVAEGGEPTRLRITSLLDGAVQTLDATHLRQWRYTSAYFNGGSVLIEIVADSGADPSRLRMSEVWIGPAQPVLPLSICGPDDDRVLSGDDRLARVVPVGCSVWLINDANHCFLTAGHCTGASFQIVEFNVPLSDGAGNIQHPGPEDQYAVDPASVQSNGGQGTGNDWAYFGCFANPDTNLTPFEAQGVFFVLSAVPPPVQGQTIRITGYGTTGPPVPNEWNLVQKTHSGPYVTFDGTLLQYQVDTTGGNSGSPVTNLTTGEAIGIHTHAGCNLGGGENNGTGINHAGLQNALANPQGVCMPLPPLAFDYPNDLPALLDPAGGTIRVEVSGQNGGLPEPGTGLLHYDDGGGFVSVPMVGVLSNVYDAVFGPIACGTVVEYYVSAETTTGETVNDPFNAPSGVYTVLAAADFDFAFSDDFEMTMGWSVQDGGGLTTGTWERGVPAGFGNRGDPATDADGSGRCFVTGIADGDNDVDDGSTILASPVMDATEGDAHITYWRWYHNSFGGNPASDVMVIEVSNNGGLSWTELETVGPTGPEVAGGWFFKSFRVADFVTPTNQFRVRFTASDLGGASVVEAGVDLVRLNNSAEGYICAAPCPTDVNGDGATNVLDLIDLLLCFGQPAVPGCGAQDINEDGLVNLLDLIDLLLVFGTACG